MKPIEFNTAKKIAETLNKKEWRYWKHCDYIYDANDSNKLMHYADQITDDYLLNRKEYYPAPYPFEVIDYLENEFKWAIYVTPRFDGFDRSHHGTYFEICKIGEVGGRDYSSDAHVGDRYESMNRAIIEVCDLINNKK